MGKKLTTEEFIQKAIEVHDDKYDYLKVIYVTASAKVIITCKQHGDFLQTPNSHISKKAGCPECKKDLMSKRFTTSIEEILRKFRETHGDRYIYHLEGNPKSYDKVKIECREHGIFTQGVSSHIAGRGCPTCADINRGMSCRVTLENVIEDFKKVHGNKYDYSKVKLIKAAYGYEKVTIGCPVHGYVKQGIHSHKISTGCPICGREKSDKSRRKSGEEFIEVAKRVHGDKYDYSKVVYKNCKKKVIIICPKHGEFTQTPDGHIQGKGCSKCTGGYNGASRNEYKLLDLINSYGYDVLHSDRRIIRPKELDFVIPELKIAIEYNGHFFHSLEKKNYKYHNLKYELAREKGYKMLSIWDFDFLNKRDVVERYLDFVLKGDDGFNQKCERHTKRIPCDVAYGFYKDNSLFSIGNNFGTSYGLFEKDVLVAVCCLRKHLDGYYLNYYASIDFSSYTFDAIIKGIKEIDKSLNTLYCEIHNGTTDTEIYCNSFTSELVSKDNFEIYRYHYKYGATNQFEWQGELLDNKLKEMDVKVKSDDDLLEVLKKKHNLHSICDCGYDLIKILL